MLDSIKRKNLEEEVKKYGFKDLKHAKLFRDIYSDRGSKIPNELLPKQAIKYIRYKFPSTSKLPKIRKIIVTKPNKSKQYGGLYEPLSHQILLNPSGTWGKRRHAYWAETIMHELGHAAERNKMGETQFVRRMRDDDWAGMEYDKLPAEIYASKWGDRGWRGFSSDEQKYQKLPHRVKIQLSRLK